MSCKRDRHTVVHSSLSFLLNRTIITKITNKFQTRITTNHKYFRITMNIKMIIKIPNYNYNNFNNNNNRNKRKFKDNKNL